MELIFHQGYPIFFFCGISRPNIPLSKSVIKKWAQLTVFAPEIDFVEKTCFFQILDLFDPLETRGGGQNIENVVSDIFISYVNRFTHFN